MNLPLTVKILVNDLIKKGGVIENIVNTDIYIINFQGKIIPFVKEYNPAIPFSYGIFFLSEEYIRDILIAEKIPYKKQASNNSYKILITKNGYWNILEKKSTKDLTSITHFSFYKLAKKLIDNFPNLGYLVFEISAKSHKQKLSSNNYYVTGLSISLGKNIVYPLRKGNQQKNPVDEISGILVKDILT